MLLDLAAIAGGLLLLAFGGEALVKGAVALARKLNVPVLIIGLTVVAFGTSAPELIVSIDAVTAQAAGVAYGNIVGSNIANIGLALAIPAMIFPIKAEKGVTRDAAFMLVACLAFAFLTFDGALTLLDGLALLLMLGLYLGLTGWLALKGDDAAAHAFDEEIEKAPSKPVIIARDLIFGIVALPLGADFLVGGASRLAADLGVDESVIGLTAVAIGTSLPEIATGVSSARRKETSILIGNVIGSNLFNALAVGGAIGATGAIAGVGAPTPAGMATDNAVMLAAVGLCAGVVFLRMAMGRLTGLTLATAYALYILAVAVRAGGGGS